MLAESARGKQNEAMLALIACQRAGKRQLTFDRQAEEVGLGAGVLMTRTIGEAGEPTVLVFRSSYLPVSETFIRDHILGLKRWRPVVGFCDEVGEARANIAVRSQRIMKGRRGELAEALARLVGEAGLDRLIRENQPGLIHAHFLHGGLRMMGAARRYGLPLIVTAHGNDATLTREARMRTRQGRRFLRKAPQLMQAVSKVVCVSEFIRQTLIADGWPADKLVYLPLGIDLTSIRPPLEPARRAGVLHVGRLVEKKGARHLIRAMSMLPNDLRDTPLTVVGDGPLRGELETLVRNLNVRATFLGAQPRAAGLDLMGRAAVLVLSSVRAADGDAEGLPIVVMEAQARACPVVMFDVAGARSAIADGESGLLARDRDDADLAAQLTRILSDDDLARRLSEGGPRIALQRFDAVANIAALEDLYDQVTALA